MTTKEISSKKEAEEMLAQLEKFYRQPVLPLRHFCQALETWMDCIWKRNSEPAEIELREDLRPHPYFKHLPQMRIDIRKSNLLGRLLFAKQQLRTRRCPVHNGHWSGEAMFFEDCPHHCDGTGWLRERQQDGRYTGELEITVSNDPSQAD